MYCYIKPFKRNIKDYFTEYSFWDRLREDSKTRWIAGAIAGGLILIPAGIIVACKIRKSC